MSCCTTIYVIRHAETNWNAEGRIQGRTDIPLNLKGIQEAFDKSQAFRHLPITVCYTSPLSRAYQTLTIFNEIHQQPIFTHDKLIERCYGSHEGLSISEVRKKEEEKGFYSMSAEDTLRFKIEGGYESYEEIYQRVYSVLKSIIQKHPGQSVLVVTHGCVIKALVAYLGKNKDVRTFRIANLEHIVLKGDSDRIEIIEDRELKAAT